MRPAANFCGWKNSGQVSCTEVGSGANQLSTAGDLSTIHFLHLPLGFHPAQTGIPLSSRSVVVFSPTVISRARISSSGASGALHPTTSNCSPFLNEVSISFRKSAGATCTRTVLLSVFTTKCVPSNGPGTSRISSMTPLIFTSFLTSYLGPVLLVVCAQATDSNNPTTAAISRTFDDNLEFIVRTSFRPKQIPTFQRKVRIRTRRSLSHPPHLGKPLRRFATP